MVSVDLGRSEALLAMIWPGYSAPLYGGLKFPLGVILLGIFSSPTPRAGLISLWVTLTILLSELEIFLPVLPVEGSPLFLAFTLVF